MSSKGTDLSELRAEIDRLDTAIYDSLKRRMGLIDAVAQVKSAGSNDSTAMRPGREAEILRRFAAQGDTVPPFALTARVWREIVNTATRMQGPIKIAVCAPDKSVGYWDLARNHFGSSTPMSLHRSPSVVLTQVTEQRGTIGLLPLPQEGEDNPWWIGLSTDTGRRIPKIIWRLPFYATDDGVFETLEAMVIADLQPEETGNDVTITMIETDLGASRGRILDLIKKNNSDARIIAAQEYRGADMRLLMVEVDGFHDDLDVCFSELIDYLGEGLRRRSLLGAYPKPIDGG